MANRTTKTKSAKTIYRMCKCGDDSSPAIKVDFDRGSEKIDGVWHTVYKCRNCREMIVGPATSLPQL